jgi:hypothetical protein
MNLGNRAGPFPKSLPTTTLSKVFNGLVYGSSLLAAAVSSNHVLNPAARSDIPIQCYGLVKAAGLLAQGQKKHADDEQ